MTRTTVGLIVLAIAVVAAFVWLAGDADAAGCVRTPAAAVCQTEDVALHRAGDRCRVLGGEDPMSNYPNEFQRRFAIRMPNGQLYGEAPVVEDVTDYTMNSAQRDYQQMMNMALGIRRTPPKPQVAGPTIFDRRQAAEMKLAELQKQAAAVGVDAWGGVVVEQICTPFTSGDPSIDFAEQIVAWTRENGGQS